MRRKRSSTVEPVWGTLMNFMAVKRINARGLAAANKVLIIASALLQSEEMDEVYYNKSYFKGSSNNKNHRKSVQPV
jgi:hypothetical protein